MEPVRHIVCIFGQRGNRCRHSLVDSVVRMRITFLLSAQELHPVCYYVGRVDLLPVLLVASCLDTSLDSYLPSLFKVLCTAFRLLSENYDAGEVRSPVITVTVFASVDRDRKPCDRCGTFLQFGVSCEPAD